MSVDIIEVEANFEAETPASNRLDQLPIVPEHSAPIEVQSYYRARTFAAFSGVNPLVTSAAALLSLLPRLRQTKEYADVNSLYQHLLHEIKAFESAASRHHYDATSIWIARYLMCAVYDDTLLHTTWGENGGWDKYQLISTYLHEEQCDERFFVIVQGLMKEPKKFIDLIEFAYICLSLGYSGRYRNHPNGYEQLAKLSSQLYQVIRSGRGEFPKELASLTGETTNKRNKFRTLPIWATSLGTLIILSLLYFGFNTLARFTAAPIEHEFSNIQHLIYTIDDNI